MFGPVVAPLIVATIVFIVIATITGTSIASISSSIPTPVRVGIAFLVGGLVAAKAHSWAKGRVDAMMYSQSSLGSSTSQPITYSPAQPRTSAMSSSGGLPPVNIPAHLVPS